ncbi:MAG: hypothetical protein K0R63_959 [Rickettsiales bacterium]|jgi:uncharacterized membrane protein|nr:hypothetical protein [Rickettsiales bacterium]
MEQKNERRHYVAERTQRDYRTSERRTSGPRNNQGYNSSSSSRRPRLSHNILPPPGILEAYEALDKGASARLFEQARKEQEHRHAWEDNYLKAHSASYKLGQFIGYFSVLSIIAGTVYLGLQGYRDEAIALSVSGFGFLTLTAFVSAKGRRFARRPSRYPNARREDGSQNSNYSKEVDEDED